MIKKIKVLPYILLYFTLSGCVSDKMSDTTYFGGKIENPKSNKVILYTMEKVVDTFFLNSKNKFIGKIENANEGLYYFSHGDENQYVYIEPNDSIMLRLNTWDFDESLVFVGKGADRNNILIDCFLENENDNKLFYDFNKLGHVDFKNKVDSLLSLKMITFSDYVNHHPNETNNYRKILKIALTFPIYARLERYPYIHAKISKKDSFPKLETNFYSYRKEININSDSLMYYAPYSRYVRNNLYNETYALGHPPTKREFTSQFTIDLLKTIDRKIVTERTKNAILRQTIISHFYNKSSCNINKDAFDTFLELSTNQKDKELILKLLLDTKSVSLNKRLPNFQLTNYTNSNRNISDVIKNKNTFLLFWSPEYVSEDYIASRINYLSDKYQNIQFIEIKMDGNFRQRIRKIDIKNQYYLKDDSKAHEFLTSKMPRSILVNQHGKVVNAYAAISSTNLNSYLTELNQN